MAEKPSRSKKGWTAGIPHRQIHAQSKRRRVCSTFPTGDKDVGTVLGTDRQNRITFHSRKCPPLITADLLSHRVANTMSGRSRLNRTQCETSGQLERWSRDWLMFCSSPFPVAMGIVLPGNCLRPFFDCFGSVANLRWPCLLLLISRCSSRTKHLSPCKMNSNYINIMGKGQASCSRSISKQQATFPGKTKLPLSIMKIMKSRLRRYNNAAGDPAVFGSWECLTPFCSRLWSILMHVVFTYSGLFQRSTWPLCWHGKHTLLSPCRPVYTTTTRSLLSMLSARVSRSAGSTAWHKIQRSIFVLTCD